jgi:hypothetical protein
MAFTLPLGSAQPAESLAFAPQSSAGFQPFAWAALVENFAQVSGQGSII